MSKSSWKLKPVAMAASVIYQIASTLLKHKTIKFTRVKKMTSTFLNIHGHDCEIQAPLSLQSELSLYKFS